MLCGEWTLFGLYSGRVRCVKEVWVDYLTSMLQAPSPTINSSLNFGNNDNSKPRAKAGTVPK